MSPDLGTHNTETSIDGQILNDDQLKFHKHVSAALSHYIYTTQAMKEWEHCHKIYET